MYIYIERIVQSVSDVLVSCHRNTKVDRVANTNETYFSIGAI